MTETDPKMPPEEHELSLDSDLGKDLPSTGMAGPVAGENGADEPGAPMTEKAGIAVGKAVAAPAAKTAPAVKVAAKKAAPAAVKKPAAEPAAPGDLQMPAGPLVTVVTRNEFYRDGFRNIMKIAIAEAVIIVAMIVCFLFYMNLAEPQDRYFATTADGRIMRLVPLDQPNMAVPALMSWVAQAATDVMTFGFHDYQRRLQDASRHFTRRGWETFTEALQKSRIIEGVEKTQQVLTAAPKSAPILVQEGILNGRYRWVIEMPLMVTYRAGGASKTDTHQLRLVIERMPSLENPVGVGIEQWIAQ